MPKFAYTAVDPRGQRKEGVVEATSSEDAALVIKNKGFFPTQIEDFIDDKTKAAAIRPIAPKGRGVSHHALTVFTQQLAVLIDAGMPLVRAFRVLGEQERNPVLKATINDVRESLEGGDTLAESMSRHPRVFGTLYINMVEAGETGGVLDQVLNRIAQYMDKVRRLRNKVASVLAYPAIVLLLTVVILVFMLIFIIPRFREIFTGMLEGRPLPWLTEAVVGVSQFAIDYWYAIVAGGLLLSIGFQIMRSTKAGRYALDRMWLNMPVLGGLNSRSSIAGFARTLGTLIVNGVPILQAIQVTRATAGNKIIEETIGEVYDAVREGESMVMPLEGSPHFPPMVTQMLTVGEETGKLPDMLMRVADVYDEEVDYSVSSLTSLIEPLLIVFLAFVVGIIVVALFLPLVTVIQSLQAL